MGNLTTWSMVLAVFVVAALATILGMTLFIVVVTTSAHWRQAGLRGGLAGVVFAGLLIFIGLLGFAYAGADGSLPSGYAPQHWTAVGAVAFLMLIGAPSASLGFVIGCGLGCLFRRRSAAEIRRAED